MSFVEYKDMLIWSIFIFAGALLLYKLWFEPEWQKIRIDEGVGSSRHKKPPAFYRRLIGVNRLYIGYKLKLLFYAFLFSSIITAICFYAFCNKSLDGPYDFLRVCVSLGTTYFLILGLRNADKSRSDNIVTALVAGFKNKCIKPLADDEWTRYVYYIEDEVEWWYEDDKSGEDCCFAGLLVRLQSDLFDIIIGKGIAFDLDECGVDSHSDFDSDLMKSTSSYNEEELLFVIKNQSVAFMRKYIDGDKELTLVSEVQHYLFQCLEISDFSMYDLAEFIDDNEKSCSGKTKAELTGYMKEILYSRQNSVKTVKVREVGDKIGGVLDKKYYGRSS